LVSDGVELGEIEFAEIRQELQTGVNDEKTKMELAATAAELAKMANSNKQLVDLMRQQKKSGAGAGGAGLFMNPMAKRRGKKVGKSSRNNKKEYAPRSVGRRKGSGANKKGSEDSHSPLTALPAEKTGLARRNSYKKHKSQDGKSFYENTETGATSWSVPDDAVILQGRDAQADASKANGKPTHKVHKSADGKVYYEHLETGATAWKLPAGAVAVDEKSEKAAKNEAARQRRSSFKGRRMSKKESFRVSDMDQSGKSLEQAF
jgi:hypothetical protein